MGPAPVTIGPLLLIFTKHVGQVKQGLSDKVLLIVLVRLRKEFCKKALTCQQVVLVAAVQLQNALYIAEVQRVRD